MFRNRVLKLFFWTLLLLYPTISIGVLRLFQCQDIGAASYLNRDLSLECYTELWGATATLGFICFWMYDSCLLLCCHQLCGCPACL